MANLRCTKCKTLKDLDCFVDNKYSKAEFKKSSWCKECKREQNRNYRLSRGIKPRLPPFLTKEEILAHNVLKYKKLRESFLEMYGNQCNCCGESQLEFLTIEHKLGQKGVKRQTSSKAYREAIKVYSHNLYEIPCMNCNHAKGRYGYCPHNKDLMKEEYLP